MSKRVNGRGFSLIELLVVVAIIALLVSILLPALGAARQAAWKAKSLSNLHQILLGTEAYRRDFREEYPLTPSYLVNRYPPLQALRSFEIQAGSKGMPWCTWSAWGKNTDGYWAAVKFGLSVAPFDWEAADRPANEYILPDVNSLYAPTRPNSLPSTSAYRKLERLIFRDPSDRESYLRPVFSGAGVTHQDASWSWYFSKTPAPNTTVSAYDDTGTSYQWNPKWYMDNTFRTRMRPMVHQHFDLFMQGVRIMRDGSAYDPSRFVFTNDQYAEAVPGSTDEQKQIRNGYGDINRGMLGFADGHAAYLPLYAGGTNGAKSYKNEHYSFVFEFLKPVQ